MLRRALRIVELNVEYLRSVTQRAVVGVVAEDDGPAQRRQDQHCKQRRDADLKTRLLGEYSHNHVLGRSDFKHGAIRRV